MIANIAFFDLLAQTNSGSALKSLFFYAQIFIGFSFIIFVHELGHFVVAKWAGVRVERFAVGFFREVFGFTYGETRYSFNLLPLGGYVKMLGQEDFEIDASGDLQVRDDPRSFANKSVGKRMAIVSAGVIMNLILAAVFFMIVFMVGLRVAEPKIGTVLPDRPAARAGLLPGDRIVSINGEEINEFKEINMSVILAPPGKPLDFGILRDGEIKHIPVEPQRDPRTNVFAVGIASAQNNIILAVGPEYDSNNPKHPRIYDRVVQINGQEVNTDNANEMMNLLFTDPLGVEELIVVRPEKPPEDFDNLEYDGERVKLELVPRLQLLLAETGSESPHILGLAPPVRVNSVTPQGRADLAGLETDDIILRWDDIDYPSALEIKKSIAKRCKTREEDISVTVRGKIKGKVVERQMIIRPKVKVSPITRRRSEPDPGATFLMWADDWLKVGRVVDEVLGKPTPAKIAGIPQGATITHIDGQPVSRWTELAEFLRAQAGKSVTLSYKHQGEEGLTASMQIPESVRTMLGLGPESRIVSVAGKDVFDVTMKDKTLEYSVKHPWALRSALQANVGKTVEIRYRRHQLAEAESAQITVKPEMVEPWVGLMVYSTGLSPGASTFILRKSNPLAAIKVGAKKTYYFVYQVYQVMERMIFSRSLSMESMSGPVGILKIGRQVSESGWTNMLYFLAMISANLAVINFLPLPIVDGGLMVFLMIEKIKGSPVSIKVQVATQVVGLILIASAFVVVTIQDLAR